MNHIFTIIWIIWLLSEILLNRLFKAKMKSSEGMDKNSLRLIWVTIFVAIFAGVFVSHVKDVPITQTMMVTYFGLALIILGIIFRFVAIRTLGKFFTVDLALHDDHKLIQNGMYKYIRHPSYTGSLLSFFGFGLSLNNWLSLVIVFIPVLISFINRMNIEEKLLVKQFGSAYEDYKKNTKRLIPIIY